MNRSTLRSRVYFLLGLTSGTTFSTPQVNDELNFIYQKINNLLKWPFLERSTTFATVASQSTYYLPLRCREIYTMSQRVSPYKIDVIDAAQFDREAPDPTTAGTGNPYYAILYGVEMTRIPTATTDTAQAGTDTNTVVGNSSSFSATNDAYNDWLLINTNSSHLGNARISDYVGATKTFELETTITGQTTGDTFYIVRALKSFELYPAPSSVITVYLKYLTTVLDMSDDSDVPAWGPDGDNFHETIAIFTASSLKRFTDQEKADKLMEAGNVELKKMQKSLFAKSYDQVHARLSLNDITNRGTTSLGAYYPPVALGG